MTGEQVAAWLAAWTDGYLARGRAAPNPHDRHADPLRWRAWLRGYRGALLGTVDDPGAA